MYDKFVIHVSWKKMVYSYWKARKIILAGNILLKVPPEKAFYPFPPPKKLFDG